MCTTVLLAPILTQHTTPGQDISLAYSNFEQTMDWQKLDLAKASVLKREVDVVLQKLYDTNPETNKSRLCTAVHQRIQDLDSFCAANSDGT
jgi:hypothetical protein